DQLTKAGMRVKLDDRNEKVGYKIREAQVQKINYMLVIGDREMENGQVAVRSRKEGDKGAVKVEEFLASALEEIRTKAL
ncbi:MAG TPA: threonine--tRNA ligase, partial [Clostridiales bacterium]|nr:threonine--tRNA ligase [Clostridiales bacterium]